jgi:hypothetical protein
VKTNQPITDKPRIPKPAHPVNRREPLPWQCPKPSEEDPQAPARVQAILQSPSYRRADVDLDFLARDAVRALVQPAVDQDPLAGSFAFFRPLRPELCFNFHYFAMRKLHFLLRAKALVAFPGGYGRSLAVPRSAFHATDERRFTMRRSSSPLACAPPSSTLVTSWVRPASICSLQKGRDNPPCYSPGISETPAARCYPIPRTSTMID